MDRAGAYLEKIAERVDLQRALEVRTPQARAALQPVVAEAQRIATAETREAAVSQRVADRAVVLERRAEISPNAPAGSPSEIDTKRSLLRQAEQLTPTEGQKAAAAQEAQRAWRRTQQRRSRPLLPRMLDLRNYGSNRPRRSKR